VLFCMVVAVPAGSAWDGLPRTDVMFGRVTS
jgi:hypothetical protein